MRMKMRMLTFAGGQQLGSWFQAQRGSEMDGVLVLGVPEGPVAAPYGPVPPPQESQGRRRSHLWGGGGASAADLKEERSFDANANANPPQAGRPITSLSTKSENQFNMPANLLLM